MIIYKPTDRIPIEVGDLKITLAPLTLEQKAVVQSFVKIKSGKSEVTDEMAMVKKTLHFSVKEVEGLENWDGSEVKVSDEYGNCCPDVVDQLLDLPETSALIHAIGAIAKKEDINMVKGVKVIKAKGVRSKKARARS